MTSCCNLRLPSPLHARSAYIAWPVALAIAANANAIKIADGAVHANVMASLEENSLSCGVFVIPFMARISAGLTISR